MNSVKKFFMRLFGKETQVKVVSDEDVVNRYVETGALFGDSVSYIYMGQCVGFEDQLNAWEKAEREYAALGFRTISLDDFVSYGGYGKEIEGLRTPRDIDEEPVFHAAYYREAYLDKISPAIDFSRVMGGEIMTGNYAVPTTKHLGRK